MAIGTAHGPYKGEPVLDFERLAAIKKVVPVPLVLHGASGVPAESIRKAIELGVCKINIDTELRQAFVRGVQRVIREHPDEIDRERYWGRPKKQ